MFTSGTSKPAWVFRAGFAARRTSKMPRLTERRLHVQIAQLPPGGIRSELPGVVDVIVG